MYALKSKIMYDKFKKKVEKIKSLKTQKAKLSHITIMNENFKQLTRQEKRLLVMEDAYQSYLNKEFNLRKGRHYLPKKLLTYNDWELIFNGSESQQRIIEGEKCIVCMKGGLILSRAKLGNKIKFDTKKLSDNMSCVNPLKDIFSKSEWYNIEDLFENGFIHTKKLFKIFIYLIKSNEKIDFEEVSNFDLNKLKTK